MEKTKKLVLASASPRRRQLLEEIGVPFIVHSAEIRELDSGVDPKILVHENAMHKAKAVAPHYDNALIVGVDTIGVVGHEILNKPQDRQDAKRLLQLLSGTTHHVMSGICVIDTSDHKMVSGLEVTEVEMDEISDQEMEAYLDSGEGDDKAAGYAIQGKGALFVKKINGDYFNVVGLPIYRLRKILQKFGVGSMI